MNHINMKQSPLIVLLAISFCASYQIRAQTSNPISLDQLLQTARSYHPILQKEALINDGLAAQLSQLSKNYYPQLSANAQATWQSEVTSIKIPFPGIDIQPPPKDQYKATLDLQQSIWDGGQLSGQKYLVSQSAEVERKRLGVEWYQVQQTIVNLYFNAALAQTAETQAKNLYTFLDAQIEKARVAQKNGIIIEKDVESLRARQLEALQNQEAYHEQVLAIGKSLELLTGQPLNDKTIQYLADETSIPASASTITRPEIGLFQAQRNMIAAQERNAKLKDKPRIGAFATGGYGRPALNFLSNTFEPYFIGGVQAKLPLSYLYTGTRKLELQQLTLNRSIVDKQEQAFLISTQAQVEAQNGEIAKLEKMLKTDNEILALRKKISTTTQFQLDHGTATMTDVINDLNLEDQAIMRKLTHSVQLAQAKFQVALLRGL